MEVDLFIYSGQVIDRFPDRAGDGVADGDTITIRQDFGCGISREKIGVRFALVDTAERSGRHSKFWNAHIDSGATTKAEVDEVAMTATDFMEACCPDGEWVLVRTHRDKSGKYGRLLAEVYAPVARVEPLRHVGPFLEVDDINPEEFAAREVTVHGVKWRNLNLELAMRGLAVRAWG